MSSLSHSDLRDRKALIFGLGATGLSVAQFMHRHQLDFTVVDDKPHPQAYEALRKDIPDADIQTGASSSECFNRADYIVVSPGISLDTPVLRTALKRGVPVIGDIELFARWVDSDTKLVAITGSNGKTTVVSLLKQMIEKSNTRVGVGGNIGTPALDLLDEKPDVYVLELSSFQLETTFSMIPSISVILNVSEDHMDRYSSIQEYRKAKMRIHTNSMCVIANRLEEVLDINTGTRMVSFGLDAGEEDHFGVIASQQGMAIACGEEVWIDHCDLGLCGEGSVLNTQAAFAIGKELGLAKPAMVEAAKTFQGLPHRLQTVGSAQQVEWINDSKATNVGAVINALRSIHKPTLLICGGVGKGADFSKLFGVVAQSAKVVIVMGSDGGLIADVLQGSTLIKRVANMHDAVVLAQELSVPGDCVLLSPACASFDMYQNYSERGDDFISEYQRVVGC